MEYSVRYVAVVEYLDRHGMSGQYAAVNDLCGVDLCVIERRESAYTSLFILRNRDKM